MDEIVLLNPAEAVCRGYVFITGDRGFTGSVNLFIQKFFLADAEEVHANFITRLLWILVLVSIPLKVEDYYIRF